MGGTPRTYSVQDVDLRDGRADAQPVVDPGRLRQLLASTLGLEIPQDRKPRVPPLSKNLATKKPRKQAKQQVRDDDDEVEADAIAASVGPAQVLPPGSMPLFAHTFVLSFSAAIDAHQAEIEAEFVKLRALLASADAQELEDPVELGRAYLDHHEGSAVLLLQPPIAQPERKSRTWTNPSHGHQLLVNFGQLSQEISTLHGANSGFVGKQRSEQAWLNALALLTVPSKHGAPSRAFANVQLALHPNPDPVAAIPFALHVTITASLTPAVFAPLESSLFAEAQRRLLIDVLPFPARSPAYQKHGNQTTIPFLYEVLVPAPSSDGWDLAEEALLANPPGLKLDLLPFQTRTVRWLLAREGVRVTGPAKGKGVKREVKDEPDMDEISITEIKTESVGDDDSDMGEVNLGEGESPLALAAESHETFRVLPAATPDGTVWAFEHVSLPLPLPMFAAAHPQALEDADEDVMEVDTPDAFFFNRLSGEVVRSANEENLKGGQWDINAEMGGMLCEEMGLGKTIEVMALLLLHKSPSWRQDIIDDETARVTAARCKQVKATLIVSPESLITQWKDEIEGHSPGLKVLVYDGYKSLPFKIATAEEVQRTREDKAARERAAERAAAYNTSNSEDDAPGPSTARGKKRAKKATPASRAGKKAKELEEGDETLWWDMIEDVDIVLCSYGTLERDFAVAAQPKQRARRANVEYQRDLKPRTPLVMVQFWRLVMDEVQLSGTPRIEEMVSLLPRVNSLAVSGTPAKAKIDDLRSTLQFLRLFPTPYFPRLLEPGLAGVFERLFKTIATRTTKSKVKAELKIPPQTRWLVPIHLSAVELTYYHSTFTRALEDLAFDEFGNGYDLNASLARTWVHTLRQIATHVQIGGLAPARHGQGHGQHGQRLHLGEQLLSMSEVLDKMIESNATDVAAARRAQLSAQVERAQLLMQKVETEFNSDFDSEALQNAPDRLTARDLLLEAVKASEKDLDEFIPIAKAAEAEADEESEHGIEDESEDKRKAHHRRMTAMQRVREVRLLRHRALYLLGDWYHVAKEEVKETKYYEAAAALRMDIHARPERNANRGITRLNTALEHLARTTSTRTRESDLVLAMPEFTRGILSGRAVDGAVELYELLAKNGELLWRWREKILRLLRKEVEAEPDEDETAAVEGMDEYAAGMEIQAIIDAHIQAYLVALSDRSELLNGRRSVLAALELRPARKKKANTAALFQHQDNDEDFEDADMDLTVRLMRERAKFMLNTKPVSRINEGRPALKTIQHQLQNVAHSSHHEREAQIAEMESDRLKKVIASQLKLVETLQTEGKLLETAFNARVVYFREKQVVSDSVARIDTRSVSERDKQLEAALAREQAAATKLGGLVGRGRFLMHLDTTHRGGNLSEDDRTCAVCFEPFIKGVLFACSHMLCSECYRLITRRHNEGVKCPTCREPVHPSDVNRIIIAAPTVASAAESEEYGNGAPTAEKRKKKGKGKAVEREADRTKDLNILPPELCVDISRELITGEWGSKINFLIKHLLYLGHQDRGYKAVVFSAFTDGLSIIQRALTENGIGFSAATVRNIRTVAHEFKEDPSKRVFVLHGERESSGLTLTCAKYVFLLEPTVAPSFELQAVGRVDRLGQRQETQVFCYFSDSTIDESVVHLQVSKKTSIYLKSAAGTNLPVNATRPDDGKVEGETKKLKGGDFVARLDDLAALLFPDRHLFALPAPAPDNVIEVEDSDDEPVVLEQQVAALIGADAAERRLNEPSRLLDAPLRPARAGPGPSSLSSRRLVAEQRALAAERRLRESSGM